MHQVLYRVILWGTNWFDLYPNGVYIADAGRKEFDQINKEVSESVTKIINTIDQYCESLKLTYSDCFLIGFFSRRDDDF